MTDSAEDESGVMKLRGLRDTLGWGIEASIWELEFSVLVAVLSSDAGQGAGCVVDGSCESLGFDICVEPSLRAADGSAGSIIVNRKPSSYVSAY